MGITLHLSGVKRGEQRIQRPIEIEANFVPKITDEGPSLFRDGDVAVHLSSGEQNEDASLREFLIRKFGAVFQPEIYFHGLTPPTGGSLGKLRLLTPMEFRSTGGWLTVAYELTGQINPATLPIAQSALRPRAAQ